MKMRLNRFIWKNATEEQKKNRMRLIIEQYIEKKPNVCWDWNGNINSSGYAHIKIGGRDSLRSYNAHRIAYLVYVGSIEKNKIVCHKCDNRKCCNPEHLFLGTYKDNMVDMVNKKRNMNPKGSQCSWSKLNEDQVLKMLELFKNGKNCAEVAREFGIDRRSASDIKRGRKWGHIGDRSNILKIRPHKKRINYELAKQIKQLFIEGNTVAEVTKKFNISRSTIDDIKKGRTWKAM